MGNTVLPPLVPQEPQPKVDRRGVVQTQPPTTVLDLLAQPREAAPQSDDISPLALSAIEYGKAVAREASRFSGEWLKQQTVRTARAFGDASINAARLLANPFVKIGEIARDPFTDPKGVPQFDTLDLLGMMMSTDPRLGDLPQVARELQTERLGETEVVGDAIGSFLSFATPTGPVGIVGRGGAVIGRVATNAAEMWAAKQLAKNRITPERIAQLRASGSLLTEAAKAGEWGNIGRAAIWGGQRISNHFPSYTALLAQSYASAPDAEREASFGHTALLGPLMIGIGRAGQWIGQKVANLTFSKASKQALLEAEEALRYGVKDPTTSGRKWLQRAQFLPANATASLFEGVGFGLLDPETIGLIRQYAEGDADAGRKLFWKVAATTGGVLVTKHLVPHDMVPYFRRIYPELNDLRLQRDADRRAQYAAEEEAQVTARGERLEEAGKRLEQEFEYRDAPTEDPHGEMMVAATRPLHRSGWLPKKSDAEGTEPEVVYQFGTHEFTVKTPVSAEQPSLQVVVPARTWNEIQRAKAASPESRNEILQDPTAPPGEQHADASSRESLIAKEPVTLTGLEAARFIESAALVAAARRIQAELDLSALGHNEIEAGGLWKGPYGAVGVDLDRSLLKYEYDGSKQLLPEIRLGGWADPANRPRYRSDKMDAIATIVAGKAQGWPEPIQDQAVTAAVALGVFGQNSPSAREVRTFIEGLPFDPAEPSTSPVLQRILTPDGMRRFALELAMLGSGNSNAVDSLARLRKFTETAVQQAKPGQLQLTFEGERTPQPSETLADYLAEERFAWEGGAQQPPEGRQVEPAAEVSAGAPPPSVPGKDLATPVEQPSVGSTTAEKGPPRPDLRSLLFDIQSRQEQPLSPSVPFLVKETAKVTGAKPSELLPQVERWVEGQGKADLRETENQGGFIDVFRKPEQPVGPKRANLVTRAIRYVTENIPEQVARFGDAVGKLAGRDLARAFDRARDLRRRTYDIERAGITAGNKATAELHDTIQGTGSKDALYPRWQEYLERRGEPQGEQAKQAIEQANQLEREYWQAAQDAQVVRWQEVEVKKPDGSTERVVRPELLEGEGGNVAIRLRGEDFQQVVETPKLLRKWAETIVAENAAAGQPLKLEVVENALADWSPGEFTPYKREIALEKMRQWQRLPPMFRDETGKVWKVGEVNFENYLKRVAASQSDRIAAIEHFGQSGLTPEDRERLGIARPNLEDRLIEYRKAAGSDAAKLLESAVARLHGMGDKRDALSDTYDRLEGTRRAIEVATAGLYDPGDILTIAGFGKTGQFLRAFSKFARHPIESLHDMRRLGAIMLDRGTTDLSDRSGLLEKLRDFATTFSRFTETTKQVITARMAKEMANDMESGITRNNARLRETLQVFWPEKDRIEPMLRGEGTPAEYERFVREFTKRATGQYRQGEGSRAHASRNFNRVFAYWRHFMARSHLFIKHVARVYETAADVAEQKPGATKQFLVATEKLAQFTGRSIAAGLISQFIGMWVREGWTSATDRWWREILYRVGQGPLEAAKLAFEAFGSQVLGGTIMSAYRGYTTPGMSGADIAAGASTPTRVGAELANAVVGRGSYAGENAWERLGTYATRAPLVPRFVTSTVKGWMAAVSASDSKVGNAIRQLNAFNASLGKPLVAQGPDPDNAPLYYANKEIRELIATHPDEEPEQLLKRLEPKLRESLKLGEGKDIATSLRAAKRLTVMKPVERNGFAQYAGKDALATLYKYDRALEMVADAYDELAGTPKEKTPFAQRLAAVEQQAAEFGAEDLWPNLREGVIDRAVNQIIDGDGIPNDEWEQLAAAMSRHPETLAKVLSAKNFAIINSLPRGEAGLLMEAWTMQAIANAVRARVGAQRRELRDSAFMDMLK